MSSKDSVYIVKFEKHPNKVKIGFSINLKSRMKTLSQFHGKPLEVKAFSGYHAKHVERILHKKFKDYNTRVDGDGGTEFFSDVVNDDAQNLCKTCGLEQNNLLFGVKKSLKRKSSKTVDEFDRKYYNIYGTTDRGLFYKHLKDQPEAKIEYCGNAFIFTNDNLDEHEVSLKWRDSKGLNYRHFNMLKQSDIKDIKELCNIVDKW